MSAQFVAPRAPLLAIIVGLLPSLALAQEPQAPQAPQEPQQSPAVVSVVDEARAHFQKGVDYYVDGDLAGALGEFRRAYALQPTYRLLYNFGQVAYEQRDYVAAERYFRAYLKDGGDEIDAQRRDEVARDLERLKGRIADLSVHSNVAAPTVFIDGQPLAPAALAAPVRVSAGRRTLRAESPGYAPVTRIVDVVGGEALTVELAFTTHVEVAQSARADESARTNPALWTGIATGVLALGTGGMALWTNSDDTKYADALDKPTSRTELDSLADRTRRNAFITDVLLGATIITGAVTVFLLLTDDEPAERAKPAAASIQVGVGSVRAAF